MKLYRKSKRLQAAASKNPRALYCEIDDTPAPKPKKRRRSGGNESVDGEVEVLRERTLDEQIADREREAAKNGNVVDLC